MWLWFTHHLGLMHPSDPPCVLHFLREPHMFFLPLGEYPAENMGCFKLFQWSMWNIRLCIKGREYWSPCFKFSASATCAWWISEEPTCQMIRATGTWTWTLKGLMKQRIQTRLLFFVPLLVGKPAGGFKQWLTPWFTTHIRLRIGWCDGTPFMPKYSIGPVSKLILEWWIPMEGGISGVLFWSQAEIHMATWGSITHSSKPSGPSIVPIFCRQADHGRAAVRFWGPESDQPGVKASWNPRHYGHFVASIYKWAISLLGRIFLGWVGDGRFR